MQPIDTWLTALGLVEYMPLFADNHIDLDIVADMSEQDLKELGICSFGYRRKLIRRDAASISSGVRREAGGRQQRAAAHCGRPHTKHFSRKTGGSRTSAPDGDVLRLGRLDGAIGAD